MCKRKSVQKYAIVSASSSCNEIVANKVKSVVSTHGKFVKDANPTAITSSNAYELTRQEGKYNAISFNGNKSKHYKKVKEFIISNDSDMTNVLITKKIEIEITQTNNNQSV